MKSIHHDSTNHLVDKKYDRIDSLPGLPSGFNQQQFSGYLALKDGGKLHYWFIESQSNPSTDPVTLWLNGGPGASSLGGLLYENGPFHINDDGETLRLNPFSWNKHTNMLYFESPVGVGFSYNNSGMYVSGDILQAHANLEALVKFYEKFPHFHDNDFYVTGESYGGVYVPTLAREILAYNKHADMTRRIHLVGIAVGNGVNEYSVNSQLFFAYYHGLFSHDIWMNLRRSCPDLKEFSKPDYNFFDIQVDQEQNGTISTCSQARLQAFAFMMSSHVNSYDIYSKCSHGDPTYGIEKLIKELLSHQSAAVPNVAQPLGLPISLCLNTTAGTNYLNREEVKRAIHVPLELEWSNIVMTNVSAAGLKQLNLTIEKPILNYGMPLQSHVVPIWKHLLKSGVRVVIYHGDVDFMCDFIGGQWAIESMKLAKKGTYQPWHILDDDGTNQTGGFFQEYEKNMTFVTIKGAGHLAPQWKPAESLEMFERFVLRSKLI